jgi:hypothetical protein
MAKPKTGIDRQKMAVPEFGGGAAALPPPVVRLCLQEWSILIDAEQSVTTEIRISKTDILFVK